MDPRPRQSRDMDQMNEEFQRDLMSAAGAIAKLNKLLNTEARPTLTVPEKITKLVKAVRAKYPAKAAECDKVDKALDDWQGEDEWHEPTSGPPSIQLDRVIFQSARTKKYADALAVIVPFVEQHRALLR